MSAFIGDVLLRHTTFLINNCEEQSFSIDPKATLQLYWFEHSSHLAGTNVLDNMVDNAPTEFQQLIEWIRRMA